MDTEGSKAFSTHHLSDFIFSPTNDPLIRPKAGHIALKHKANMEEFQPVQLLTKNRR